jgi:hypothetical protein
MKAVVVIEVQNPDTPFVPALSYYREMDLGLPFPGVGWELYLHGFSAPAVIRKAIRLESGRTYLVCTLPSTRPKPPKGDWKPVDFEAPWLV